jgi:hypothetical protein
MTEHGRETTSNLTFVRDAIAGPGSNLSPWRANGAILALASRRGIPYISAEISQNAAATSGQPPVSRHAACHP